MTASCPCPLPTLHPPTWRRLRDRHNLGPHGHAYLSSPRVALKLLPTTYDHSLSINPRHTNWSILCSNIGARGPSDALTSRRCSPRPATTLMYTSFSKPYIRLLGAITLPRKIDRGNAPRLLVPLSDASQERNDRLQWTDSLELHALCSALFLTITLRGGLKRREM
jgi:hypothetical protein